MDDKKTDLFENKQIPAAVAELAIPSVLCTLVMVLYSAADTYFVGRLGDPVQSAAVSLAAPALLAFNAVNNLFGVGSSSYMSRCFGRKDYESAKQCSVFGFWLALFCAVCISLSFIVFKQPILRFLGADESTALETGEYLKWTVVCGAVPAIMNTIMSYLIRSEGDSLSASIGVMSGCILNIILDPLFVLPGFLDMGASGAGCATFISNSLASVYFLVLLFKKRGKTSVALNPRLFTFNRKIAGEVFGVGTPAAIQNLLNVTGSLILNNATAVYGPDAVSAMGISHKVSIFPLYITMGITQGVMPFISYNYAGGNRKRMKDCINFVLALTAAITLVLGVVIYCFPGELIRAFMDNAAVIDHGSIILRAMATGVPFLAVDFMTVAVFQSIGKGSYSLFFAIARKLVLEIPAIIILNKLYPLYGMGYSQPVAECILSIAAGIMLIRIYNQKPELQDNLKEKVK